MLVGTAVAALTVALVGVAVARRDGGGRTYVAASPGVTSTTVDVPLQASTTVTTSDPAGGATTTEPPAGSSTTTVTTTATGNDPLSDGAPVEEAPSTTVAAPHVQRSIESVTVTPDPQTGQQLTVTVVVTGRRASDIVSLFADQTYTNHVSDATNRGALSCTDDSVIADRDTVVFHVAFRTPGHHRHWVGYSSCDRNAQPLDTYAPVDYEVGGATLPSNGPALPVATLTVSSPTRFAITGDDDDGVATTYSISWGDGLLSGPSGFDMLSYRDPCEPDGSFGYSHNTATTGHSYAAHGTYTVTLTVVSVGCNDENPQQSSSTYTITV